MPFPFRFKHCQHSLDPTPWSSAWMKKPSIQGLERATGCAETDNGKIVRGFKSTHKRHGTLNLFAALQVATGEIKTATTTLKRGEEFLHFMDQIVAEAPEGREIHAILDNYCTHKKCDAWLARHWHSRRFLSCVR
jgi:hypothetical protein